MGYGNGIHTLSKIDLDNPAKHWEKVHNSLKDYQVCLSSSFVASWKLSKLYQFQNRGRFTDVDLYCDGDTVVSLHLSLLHQLSPTGKRRIYDACFKKDVAVSKVANDHDCDQIFGIDCMQQWIPIG